MGLRGRPCRVCLNPELQARVESERETGASYREIAALVGLDKYKIARHFKHSGQAASALPVAEAEDENLSELELSDKRLATISQRLEQQFASACAVADQKLALDATKALARVESERHRRIVKKTEAATDAANGKGGPSIEYFDDLLRTQEKYKIEQLSEGKIICPCCEDQFHLVFPATIRQRLANIVAASALPPSDDQTSRSAFWTKHDADEKLFLDSGWQNVRCATLQGYVIR
jgi:hypothetical protein